MGAVHGSDLVMVLTPHGCRAPDLHVADMEIVASALGGSARLHRSAGLAPRVDSEVRGDVAAWVTGVTSDPHPARGLVAWWVGAGRTRAAAEPPLVGHFVAVVVREDCVSIWTDHMGTVPLFTAVDGDGRHIFGSDLWTVAELAGRTDVDPVSAREFIGRGGITSPHTIFSGVERVPPGTHVRVVAGGAGPLVTQQHYWLPSPVGAPSDVREAGALLRAAVTDFVREALAPRSAPLLLLSGGEDSRVLAALAMQDRPRGSLRAIIALDGPNRELHLAQAAARALGVTLEPRWRPRDQYTRDLDQRIRMVGPGVDLRHAHVLGLIDPGETDLILNGHGADQLLKALVLPTRRVAPGHAWNSLELDRSVDLRSSVAGERPRVLEGIWLDDEVAARRRLHVTRVGEFREGADARAWSRSWPFTDWYSHGFTISAFAVAPGAAPFLVGPTVDAVRGVPEEAKLNRALFVAAFGRSLGLSGLIPRSGGEIPGLTGPVGRAASALVSRQFSRADGRRPPGAHGPWMSDRIVADQALALLDQADPVVVEHCLSFLAGSNPGQQVLSHPHPPTRLLQLVVLADHLGVTPPTMGAAPVSNPLTHPASVRNARGVVIHVDPSDPRGRHLVRTAGDYNPISLRMWQRIVDSRSWDLVVDVGANYGEMLVGCELPIDATVVAYEPSPAVLGHLRRTLDGHRPGIRVRPVAVGDRPGRATLLVNHRWSGTTRLGDPGEEPEHEPVEVEVVTLDADLPGTAAVAACVKIDVEGGEVAVLNGAAGFLRGLDHFACLIEILHLPTHAVAELTQHYSLYLWDLRLDRFTRVAACDAASLEARLASGAYYRQDAMLLPLVDVHAVAPDRAGAEDRDDLVDSLRQREAELSRADQVPVPKAELERLRRDQAQLGKVLASRSFRWMSGPRRGAEATRLLIRRLR